MKQAIRERSRAALRDPQLQHNLQTALDHSLVRRAELQDANPRWQQQRERIAALRDEALGQQEQLLAQVRAQIRGRGGEVHVVADADAAQRLLIEIFHAEGVRRVIKGKSMVSEELGLNPALEAAGLEVWEADLGELIVQLRGEPPAHLTAPALHLNRRQIAALFRDRLGEDLSDDPVLLTAAARRFLRDKFLTADAGLTGANFVVAESGSVVLVENESNIRLATSLPRVHVAVTGLEKLVPRLTDLGPLLELLPASATGQKVTAAVSLLGGPRQPGEQDGPEVFHLILVDNGRELLRADPQLRSALRCLRCSACLNICPVFRRLGGHGFGSVYPGPIGAVLSRALLGQRDSAHAFACALCGACDEVCPAQIPLSELILELRRRCQREAGPGAEKLGHAAFAGLALRPGLFRVALSSARGLARLWPRGASSSLSAAWTDSRALPGPEPRRPDGGKR